MAKEGRRRRFGRFVWGVALVTILAMLAVGCAGDRIRTTSSSAATKSKTKRGPVPLYYDFGDVLIPSELKVQKESSFVFKTPDLTAGVLALKGRVEMNSLITFFETNMSKDNWNPVSSFKSVRTIMLFQKENRWCVVNITEGDFSTLVEIWVAPTTHQTGGGLLK